MGGEPEAAPEVSGERLRAVMGFFATGVTVLTTGGAEPQAMTANSFTSISLNPALVMFAITRSGGHFRNAVVQSGVWAVSILAADQQGIGRHFADPRRDRLRQFDRVPHRIGAQTGAPVVEDGLGWLECRTEQVIEAGDHSIILGAVLDLGFDPHPDKRPLLYYRGAFA